MSDSKSYSSDFTKYCPSEGLCDENIGAHSTRTRSQSLRVKNQVAWFSKKPKPMLLPPRHQINVRILGENDQSNDLLVTSRERSRSCVSQEELRVLQGCVSKRRALFTSNQECQTISSHKSSSNRLQTGIRNSHLASDCGILSDHHKLTTTKHSNTMRSKYHQPSDLCDSGETKDISSPSLDQPIIPDTISIQFRAESQELTASHNDYLECMTDSAPHFFHSDYSLTKPSLLNVMPKTHSKSSSIPGWLNSPRILPKCALRDSYDTTCLSSPRESPYLKVSHNESACNSWPRNQITPARSYHEGLNRHMTQPRHRLSEKSSPQHQHKESSSLSANVGTEIISSDLNLEIFGSTSSICSVQSHQSSASACSERPHFHYGKGIDGVEFKHKTDKMITWFSEFNDQQRNMLLQKLLEQSDCTQMHFLSLQLDPILQIGCPHNCQDLLSWLPSYITEKILEYLDPVSLCRASQVSRKWYQLATSSLLWMNLCKLNPWQLSTFGEKNLMKIHTSNGTVQWKAVFAEKFRLKRNWLKGYCTVRTFEGHSQGISCIQFDDTRIVSGSWDKTIKVWNRRTNTAWAALTLAGHSGTVRCLHLHGNRLVSGSSDRTIKVWDLSTDKVGWVGAACRATMVGHQHTVRCLQADDNKVISGSYDLTLKVWDIKTGQCTKTLRGHTDAVLCLQFANDDVVSGSKDMTIKVWSLSSGICTLTFHGHQAAVTCVQFDKTKIISGALDTLIKIWNFSNGECIRTMDWIRSEGHTGVIRHLQADSWKIISAADDKTMKVWSIHSGNRLLTLKSHTDGVTCLQFNDKVIVSGSYDKTVKLWDFSAC